MLDIVIIAYLLWQVSVAFHTTPSKQLNALLIRLLVIAAFSGFFVIVQLTGLIKTTVEKLTETSGILLSLGSFIVALLLLLQFKSRLMDNMDQRLAKNYHPLMSMGIAMTRAMIMSWLLLFILARFPLGLFDSMLQQSTIAQWLAVII